MSLKISIDASAYTRDLKRLERKLFPDAVRATLNDMAKKAAIAQRGMIKKKFTVRNKFVLNSIVPKGEGRFGLIPKSNSSVHTMRAFSGTLQPYMLDQERGFSKSDLSIPTYAKGRMGGTFKGKVRGPAKMKKIKQGPVRRIKGLDLKASKGPARTKQAVAMLSRQGYRGFLKLDRSDGWHEGYYKMTATKVNLVRSTAVKRKRYSKREWHKPAIAMVTKPTVMTALWERQARALLRKL